MLFSEIKTQIDEYIKGKKWYWYVPFWLYGIYIFIKLIGFDPNGQLPFVISIAQAFDFFLHEMAHIITGFLPAILTAAAGSLSEILLGSLLIYTAFKTRGYYSVMVCALWFMLACQSAGAYMADALPQRMSLVSLGGALSGSDKVTHDWNFVFGKLHILGLGTFIGDSVRVLGGLVGLGGLIFSAWLIYRMASGTSEKPLTSEEKVMINSVPWASDSDQKEADKNSQSIYPVASRGPLVDKTDSKDQSD